MLFKNIYKAERKMVEKIHFGVGQIEFTRLFSAHGFHTNIDFVDYAIIPPGSSIGFHQHQGNEELYLILQGNGKMRVGDEVLHVETGDLVMNPDGSYHGLENLSSRDIHIFVVQVASPIH